MHNKLKCSDYIRFVYGAADNGYHIHLSTERGVPKGGISFILSFDVGNKGVTVNTWTYFIEYIYNLGKTNVDFDIEAVIAKFESKFKHYLHRDIYFQYDKLKKEEKTKVLEKRAEESDDIDWEYAKSLSPDVTKLKEYASRFGLETDKKEYTSAYRSLRTKERHKNNKGE